MGARIMNYFDEYNLLHAKKDEVSENGILFLAEYVLLRKLQFGKLNVYDIIRALQSNIVTLSPPRYQANPPERGDHYSHDNMTGMYCLSLLTGQDLVKSLPVVRWNSRWWLHPRDIAFYLSCKYPKLFIFLAPILLLSLIVSLMKPKAHTSGRMLWFLRLNTLTIKGYPLAKHLLKYYIKDIYSKYRGLDELFSIYFPDPFHPNNVEMRGLLLALKRREDDSNP